MDFLKGFLRNLALLILMGVVLFVLFPDIMRQVFGLYGAIFGPLAILFLVVSALPKKSKKSSR
ncbi:hypothetical protein LARV_01130 [Longilinea arvoryzae]|uniref:Uncharacterized protein n=1 Tax=Longilinea arvoryzae TaxID=360412 RepID=A0A0S7BHS0_9CHLR|nr:hypothetical protein [Longilinea arvoryzae]GAP13377.1 hypothetical protein LARV_01130 [Longilinea arvoryzae]